MSRETIPAPRYPVGETVHIANRDAIGHCRTPWYLRGHTGTIVMQLGTFRDPAGLAYHKPGLPALPLYKVRFRQVDLWPDYRGGAGDHLEADIYETWLTPVAAETSHAHA